MSYHLVVEGIDGARRVREGKLPQRGDWLNLRLKSAWWWLPVLEVAHMLSEEKPPQKEEGGADLAHEGAEGVVFSSLSLAVKARARSEEDAYKLILPPTRWPLGGTTTADDAREAQENETN